MLSRYGEGANILHRIKQEGNQVSLYVESDLYSDTWEGLLPRIGNKWENFLSPGTIILFDSTGLGHIADKLRSRNYKIFGASKFSDRLESDREYGTRIMDEAGINSPKTYPFNSLDDGIRFLKDKKDKFVFKPSGETPSSLTYVPFDKEDLIKYMEYLREARIDVKQYVLQEFVKGITVSTEAWIQGGKIVHPLNHTIENKKLMNDDLGPSTGCSGNLTWAEFDENFLTKEYSKIEKVLEPDYTGQLDLNSIVTLEKKVYGLEWTSRMGFDATPTLLWGLYDGELGKLFADFAGGNHNYDIELGGDIAASVRLSIPPYPLEPAESEHVESTSGIPINDVPNLDSKDAYYYEIKSQGGKIVHSKGIGLVMLGIAINGIPDNAIIDAEGILAKAEIPDKQYRTDLSVKLSERYDEFVNLGG